jgi:hypothetical protein
MAPVSSFLDMAFVGHASMHKGVVHCWQTMGI